MPKRKQRVNPFYVILVVTGVMFVVTACAYGVMTLKELQASRSYESLTANDSRFVGFMDRYGLRMLVVELAILSVSAVAAMGTDRFWTGDSS